MLHVNGCVIQYNVETISGDDCVLILDVFSLCSLLSREDVTLEVEKTPTE